MFRDSIPDDDELKVHENWGWRFYGAIWQWVAGEGLDALEMVRLEAKTAADRAAAAAANIAGLVDLGEFQCALDLVRSIDVSDMRPIDRLWLKCHEAQILSDQGGKDEAKAMASTALAQLRREPNDAAGSAIIGSLTEVIVRATHFAEQDLGALLRYRDTAAAWWRAFSLEGTMFREIDFMFKSVAPINNLVIGATSGVDTESHNRLAAAATTSLLTGDYDDWRTYRTYLAKSDFARLRPDRSDDGQVASILGALRVTGDADAIGAIATDLWKTGPIGDLYEAVDSACSAEFTRKTYRTAVTIFAIAGDLASDKNRIRLVQRLSEIIATPEEAAFLDG